MSYLKNHLVIEFICRGTFFIWILCLIHHANFLGIDAQGMSSGTSSEKAEISKEKKVSSPLIPIKILPNETDSSIDEWTEPHYIFIDHSVKQRGKLFLFLAGSFGKPKGQVLISKAAAKLGYHVINLRYPNTWTVGRLCRNSNSEECHGNVRLEIFDGVDRTKKIDIKRSSSIENRLIKLLVHLEKKFPDQNWGMYLEDQIPKWESFVVAGHSQGGGHAAIIAKERRVARVIMLGAPADFNRSSKSPAKWVKRAGATPSNRFYGFSHLQDRGLRKILKVWELLGMNAFGKQVIVDSQKPPYNGSHQLVTEKKPARPGKYHACVATDGTTPKSLNGTSLFSDVWRYLMTYDLN